MQRKRSAEGVAGGVAGVEGVVAGVVEEEEVGEGEGREEVAVGDPEGVVVQWTRHKQLLFEGVVCD
jgi:hypothetical protein